MLELLKVNKLIARFKKESRLVRAIDSLHYNLSVFKHISFGVAMIYIVRTVEITGLKRLRENPLNPYTGALLSVVPASDQLTE